MKSVGTTSLCDAKDARGSNDPYFEERPLGEPSKSLAWDSRLLSHKAYVKLFFKSHFPHKSVNASFIITKMQYTTLSVRLRRYYFVVRREVGGRRSPNDSPRDVCLSSWCGKWQNGPLTFSYFWREIPTKWLQERPLFRNTTPGITLEGPRNRESFLEPFGRQRLPKKMDLVGQRLIPLRSATRRSRGGRRSPNVPPSSAISACFGGRFRFWIWGSGVQMLGFLGFRRPYSSGKCHIYI